MDELDILKQNWNSDKDNVFKTYSEQELFQMTKKKSISIAKWVFIIGLLELLFWIFLDYILPTSNSEDEALASAKLFLKIWDWITQAIPFLFLGTLLYLNFRIRASENPKKLMRKILLMRNIIKWYVRIFLLQFAFAFILGTILAIIHKVKIDTEPDIYIFIPVIFIFTIVIGFIIVLFLRFIYHLIYGKLLSKLEDNYKELTQIE